MSDFFSDLPGWAKGAIAVIVIGGGGNLAQYVGFAAPAQETATVAKEDRDWCRERLIETQDKLEKCLRECRP